MVNKQVINLRKKAETIKNKVGILEMKNTFEFKKIYMYIIFMQLPTLKF